MTQEPADAADAWEGKFEDYKNPAFKLNISILCKPNALESDYFATKTLCVQKPEASVFGSLDAQDF